MSVQGGASLPKALFFDFDDTLHEPTRNDPDAKQSYCIAADGSLSGRVVAPRWLRKLWSVGQRLSIAMYVVAARPKSHVPYMRAALHAAGFCVPDKHIFALGADEQDPSQAEKKLWRPNHAHLVHSKAEQMLLLHKQFHAGARSDQLVLIDSDDCNLAPALKAGYSVVKPELGRATECIVRIAEWIVPKSNLTHHICVDAGGVIFAHDGSDTDRGAEHKNTTVFVPGAMDMIAAWAREDGHRVSVLSFSGKSRAVETAQGLTAHRRLFSHMLFTGDKTHKGDICEAYGATIMIDDNKEVLRHVFEHSPSTALIWFQGDPSFGKHNSADPQLQQAALVATRAPRTGRKTKSASLPFSAEFEKALYVAKTWQDADAIVFNLEPQNLPTNRESVSKLLHKI